MDPAFADILRYVDFGPADSRALQRLVPVLPKVLDAMVDDFYDVILAHEDARKVLADEGQIVRLKQSLREWARSTLAGPHDEAWHAQRARIGRRHVEVGLPQRFMPLAMDRLRAFLAGLAVAELSARPAELNETLRAVQKVLDVELTIMLESYQEMTQRRVRQAERLGTLGQLAASISHELKNPLAVINTSLLLLGRELKKGDSAPDPELVRTHLERIGRSSRHAARLASQLLDYARAKKPQLRSTPLKALLEQSLELCDECSDVVIDARAEPADSIALLDAGDVTQILSNLIRNAVQAIRENGVGGRVTVRARRDALGVTLTVTDDGPGIPSEVLTRIFEPLFTTRSTGTGLGLAIARDLVAAHGGTITVSSTVGRGAAFTVMIPQERPGP
jgi:two-component system, NtrC family, sensor histidine kinase HydH